MSVESTASGLSPVPGPGISTRTRYTHTFIGISGFGFSHFGFRVSSPQHRANHQCIRNQHPNALHIHMRIDRNNTLKGISDFGMAHRIWNQQKSRCGVTRSDATADVSNLDPSQRAELEEIYEPGGIAHANALHIDRNIDRKHSWIGITH